MGLRTELIPCVVRALVSRRDAVVGDDSHRWALPGRKPRLSSHAPARAPRPTATAVEILHVLDARHSRATRRARSPNVSSWDFARSSFISTGIVHSPWKKMPAPGARTRSLPAPGQPASAMASAVASALQTAQSRGQECGQKGRRLTFVAHTQKNYASRTRFAAVRVTR